MKEPRLERRRARPSVGLSPCRLCPKVVARGRKPGSCSSSELVVSAAASLQLGISSSGRGKEEGWVVSTQRWPWGWGGEHGALRPGLSWRCGEGGTDADPKTHQNLPQTGDKLLPQQHHRLQIRTSLSLFPGLLHLKRQKEPLFFVMCNKLEAEWGPTAGTISAAHRFGAKQCIFLN